MHPALNGGLIGLAVMAALIGVEYFFVKRQVQDRASPTNPRPQFEQTDRNRIRSVVNFSIFLPPAFAIGAWLIDQFK
jgi:hypothetical protein